VFLCLWVMQRDGEVVHQIDADGWNGTGEAETRSCEAGFPEAAALDTAALYVIY
jgi:hypothetical protein